MHALHGEGERLNPASKRTLDTAMETETERSVAAMPGSASDAPRHPHTRWESMGELMVDLMMNITLRPFWVQFDRYATKITDENKDSVGHGLHLALEFQLAREPNDQVSNRGSEI